MHKSMIKFCSLALLFNLYLFSSEQSAVTPRVKRVKTVEQLQEELKAVRSAEQRLDLLENIIEVSEALQCCIRAIKSLNKSYKKCSDSEVHGDFKQDCEANKEDLKRIAKLSSKVIISFASGSTINCGLQYKEDTIIDNIEDYYKKHYREVFANMPPAEIYDEIKKEKKARLRKKSQATTLAEVKTIGQKCRQKVMYELTKDYRRDRLKRKKSDEQTLS